MQYAYPLLAIFIWAGNTVITKMSAGAIFPAEIGFYRWLLAGLLFTPFMLKPVISHWPLIRPSLGKIFILGVLGMAVYQSLAYFAASLTTATNMGIILSLMPLMSLAMAIISLGQRLTAGALVGALLSFAGVLVVVSSGSLGALLQHGVNLGDAMMLIATLAYAVYSTLLKKWQLRLPPLEKGGRRNPSEAALYARPTTFDDGNDWVGFIGSDSKFFTVSMDRWGATAEITKDEALVEWVAGQPDVARAVADRSQM